MVLLNDLLEEGAARTAELAENINGAAQAIDDLVKRARSLAEKITSEGDESHQEFQAALASVEKATQELGSATEEADGHLETLASKAGEARGKATELLADVKKAVEELEAHKAQLTTNLQNRMQGTEKDFEALEDHFEELQKAVEDKLQAADTAVETFKNALVQVQQEFQEAETRALDHMNELEQSVWDEMKHYAEAIDTGLSGAVEDLVEASNKMIAEHNQAAEAVGQKFAEDAVEKVTTSFEPLKAAVQAVADLCDESEQALTTRSAQVLEKVEEAIQIVERIRPALEAAEKLA